MKFSYIHTADIHLGRAFSNINYNLSPEQKEVLQLAHESALESLCNFAINNSVDFILIAGDTFDACEQDLHSRLKLTKILSKLEQNNIQVFIICGNHDPANSYTQELSFKNSKKIHIFGVNTEAKTYTVTLENGDSVANIHPFGFETKEFSQSPCTILKKATDHTLFNIGLIHCDLGVSESNYAPCTEKELLELDYDYYALGHIHKPYLNDKIAYSGTLQGRHSKDEGAHGFRYIRVENKCITQNEFIPCDKVRYINIEHEILNDKTEIENIEHLQAVLTPISKECELTICNLTLSGIRSFSFSDINALKKELECPNLIINSITDLTRPEIDINIIRSSGGILTEMLETIENKEALENILEQTKKEASDFLKIIDDIDNEEIISDSCTQIKNICAKIYDSED